MLKKLYGSDCLLNDNQIRMLIIISKKNSKCYTEINTIHKSKHIVTFEKI